MARIPLALLGPWVCLPGPLALCLTRAPYQCLDMTYDIEEAQARRVNTLVVRGRADRGQVSEFLGRAFELVAKTVASDGMHFGGPPFAIFRTRADGAWDIECGFPVAGVALGQGEVTASSLPGGRVVRTLHVGPYSGTELAHQALAEWVSSRGEEPAGDAWEVYLDRPDEPNPRTQVVLPLAGRR